MIPFGAALGVLASLLEYKLRVRDIILRLVRRVPGKVTRVFFYEFLQGPVLDTLAVLEAHEVAALVGEELDLLEQLRAELLAELGQGPLSVSIVQDDLLVLGAILELVPFLGV